MPIPPDLENEADQAVQSLLRSQPGLTMPEPIRIRVLSALADETATRAALMGNDADLAPATEPFTKTTPSLPTPSHPVAPHPVDPPTIERHP